MPNFLEWFHTLGAHSADDVETETTEGLSPDSEAVATAIETKGSAASDSTASIHPLAQCALAAGIQTPEAFAAMLADAKCKGKYQAHLKQDVSELAIATKNPTLAAMTDTLSLEQLESAESAMKSALYKQYGMTGTASAMQQTQNVDPSATAVEAGAEADVTPARKAELMSLSSLGRAATQRK